MKVDDQQNVRNWLLQALDTKAFAYLQPHMKRAELPLRYPLVKPMEKIINVCFIENGLASTVARNPDGAVVEIRHVGREGMTGQAVLLMVDKTPNETFMQVAGSGIFVPADRLMQGMEDGVLPRDLFLNYVHTCDIQVSQSALASGRYTMHQRLARWLLMCHDRLGRDEMPLTHEFLSIMLGVRRAGVTGQLHILEGMHAIKSTRGIVRILSRRKLLEIAGESYGWPEKEYKRLIGIGDDNRETQERPSERENIRKSDGARGIGT